MNVKLTLRLDEDLIRQAKYHANRTGKSVSRLVADYFRLLEGSPEAAALDLPPKVRSLKGSLKGKGLDRDVYRRRLEEKYR
jgi:hypothetical protein